MSVLKEQYLQLKTEISENKKNPVLLIKLGDYYESFFDDAEIIGRLLDLPLGKREGESHISMDASVMANSLWKLEKAGYTPVILKED